MQKINFMEKSFVFEVIYQIMYVLVYGLGRLLYIYTLVNTLKIKINAIYYWENYGIYINTIFSTHHKFLSEYEKKNINKKIPSLNLRCIMNDERI